MAATVIPVSFRSTGAVGASIAPWARSLAVTVANRRQPTLRPPAPPPQRSPTAGAAEGSLESEAKEPF
ncbi:hypothetical protein [Cyanobium sp. Morenito 9A2]|uniref:hypothetical protein n=1 Tax=Cyanobium sp. Morenito 9A2 TaxID=2823718 RepID=UPI0020CEF795|nr:hypothetical protein [Cyanobium sp. Morenito 9A2]MCP9849827.1 hypothetical protein [Cyanobium sp. Morenito 9A2]